MNVQLGDLRPYDLRKIWQYEDRHFTVWLCDNLERLGHALGLSLEFRARERAVGPFSLDILAHDTLRDHTVIIENQLEQTDHDHLGKLLTYASGLDARVIIWVAPTFRDQHRAALDWLNRNTSDSLQFFGVSLEAVQIDDSRPAINFKVVVAPNDWDKLAAQEGAQDDTGRRVYFYAFNQALFDALRESGQFSNLPSPGSRYETFVERLSGGVRYGTAFSRGTLRCGVWLWFTEKHLGLHVFDTLLQDRADIEASMGCELHWDRNADRAGQIITVNLPTSRQTEAIPNEAPAAARALVRIKSVLQPRIDAILTTPV
ncbi:MAG TPA: DUF4268 domain-containing protein [Candidatus Baltobacteraceae bacterium]|nr:DUF4268 domain-containing protein [Candidatus Baltobacteraceae bacterium]